MRPFRGRVTALLIKPRRRASMIEVAEAAAEARRGFMGDCHAQPLGPRQVLIVRQEDLDELGVCVRQVRANLAISGLQRSALQSGRVLRIGREVRVRITHECEVCKVLRHSVPEEVFPGLVGRRGSLGVFLTGGAVAPGDSVALARDRYPTVPDAIYERVAWVVDRIPSGRVTTYDALLQVVGGSRSYFRALPSYLKRAHGAGLPSHRVLTSASKLTGHVTRQRQLLAAEGVPLDMGGTLTEPRRLWDARRLYFRRH
jgi:alkylated DNA nucleotide flippase Atl1